MLILYLVRVVTNIGNIKQNKQLCSIEIGHWAALSTVSLARYFY